MYCTQEEVFQFTGIDVEDIDIMQATADIAMIVGTPLDLDEGEFRDRDVEVLMMATIMQTVWLKQNAPGQYSNSDVTSFSQDGESANLNPTAVVLAPRARMWINNLSWMKSRKTNMIGSSPETYDQFNYLPLYGAYTSGGTTPLTNRG